MANEKEHSLFWFHVQNWTLLSDENTANNSIWIFHEVTSTFPSGPTPPPPPPPLVLLHYYIAVKNLFHVVQLLDVTSKFHTVTMLWLYFLDNLKKCTQTSSGGSLSNRYEQNVYMATTQWLYIPHKRYLNKSCLFSKDMLLCITS